MVPDPELLVPELEVVDPEPGDVPVVVTPPVEVVFAVPPQPTSKSANATSGRTGETATLRQIPISKQPPQLGMWWLELLVFGRDVIAPGTRV